MNNRVINGAGSAVISLALAMIPCTAAFGQNNYNSGVTPHEQQFLTQMAQGDIAEIELGKLAQQKGTTAAIRDFGARMVRDHTTLDNQVKQLAAQMQVTLPTSLTSNQAQQKTNLERMSGKAFDTAYLDTMLSDHQMDVQLVQQEAESTSNPQVKTLAEQTLPILEDHLRIAENDAGRLGISAYKGLNQPEHPNPNEQAQR